MSYVNILWTDLTKALVSRPTSTTSSGWQSHNLSLCSRELMLHVGIYIAFRLTVIYQPQLLSSLTDFYEMLCELTLLLIWCWSVLLRFLEEESQIDFCYCFRKGRKLLHMFLYMLMLRLAFMWAIHCKESNVLFLQCFLSVMCLAMFRFF